MSIVAEIRLACVEAGFKPKTVSVYMKLLSDLLAKWPSEFDDDVFGMLRKPDWVERTLLDMVGSKSMPTMLGYIVSMLKAYGSGVRLTIGKQKPHEVDAWVVYMEKAAYHRGMLDGMTLQADGGSDPMWMDSVGVQTASVVAVDASTQLDEHELEDYVVPETPLSQQGVPPTQPVGEIEFVDYYPAAPMKKRKVMDDIVDAMDVLDGRVAELEKRYDMLSAKLMA
jgi:hypothetical protein